MSESCTLVNCRSKVIEFGIAWKTSVGRPLDFHSQNNTLHSCNSFVHDPALMTLTFLNDVVCRQFLAKNFCNFNFYTSKKTLQIVSEKNNATNYSLACLFLGGQNYELILGLIINNLIDWTPKSSRKWQTAWKHGTKTS